MPKSPRVPTKDMSNQAKLDFIIDFIANGGPSVLYGASLQELIDDIPRRVVKSKIERDGKFIDLDQEVADTKSIVTRMEKMLNAQAAVITKLANAHGANITEDFVRKTIQDSIKEELGDLEATAVVTLTNKED